MCVNAHPVDSNQIRRLREDRRRSREWKSAGAQCRLSSNPEGLLGRVLFWMNSAVLMPKVTCPGPMSVSGTWSRHGLMYRWRSQ